MSKDSRSDHILMINVMKEWEILKRAHNSTRNFCYDNFLSENVLQMLSYHKKQLADHLYAKSFICSSDPKGNNYFTSFFFNFHNDYFSVIYSDFTKISEPSSNINSENEDLIRAIICAGLYPNVAKFRKRMTSRTGLFTVSDPSVKFHMTSVNCDKHIGKMFFKNIIIYRLRKYTSIYFLR